MSLCKLPCEQSLFLFPTDLGRSKRLCSQGMCEHNTWSGVDGPKLRMPTCLPASKLAPVNMKMSMLSQDILLIFHSLFILQNSRGKRHNAAISMTKHLNPHVFTRAVSRTCVILVRNEKCTLLPLTKRSQCYCLCWLLGTLRLSHLRMPNTLEIDA